MLTGLHNTSPALPCPALPSPIHNFDQILTLLWHYSNINLALLWHYYDISLTLLWHYFDTTLTQVWHCFEDTLTLLQGWSENLNIQVFQLGKALNISKSIQHPVAWPFAKTVTKQPKMIRFWILRWLWNLIKTYQGGGGIWGGSEIEGDKKMWGELGWTRRCPEGGAGHKICL